MIREIKFRAWDKNNKGFINGFNMYGYSTGQGAPKRQLQRFSSYWDEEDVEIMQYTGLKDKNEKEIYEGDILKNKNNRKSKVIYYNYGFNLDSGFIKIPLFKFNSYDELEIIGNIYENPYLLEVK